MSGRLPGWSVFPFSGEQGLSWPQGLPQGFCSPAPGKLLEEADLRVTFSVGSWNSNGLVLVCVCHLKKGPLPWHKRRFN